jgi:hypothetical protein
MLLGTVSCKELESAIEQSAAVNEPGANLILAGVDAQSELPAILEQSKAAPGAPVWIIDSKGGGFEVSGAAVRKTLRSCGWIDVKVASVSARLTATRFVQVG